MKKLTKRGFTLVELVIVVAVIALLAAVLIPTFIALSKRADRVADEQLLSSMNTALAIREADGRRPQNINEVKLVLYENGINAYDNKVYTPRSTDSRFAWDPDSNRMVLLPGDSPLGNLILLTDTYIPPVTSGGTSGDTTPDNPDPPVACHDLDFIPVKALNGEDAYTVMRGKCRCEDLYIPSLHDGKPVIAIEERGFYAAGGLMSVTIPASVTQIGAEAFYRAVPMTQVTVLGNVETVKTGTFKTSRLQNITFAHDVKVIEESAFDGCGLLKQVSLGNSLTDIHAGAFSGCTKLEAFDFPDTVKTVKESAFEGCKGLVEIDLPNSISSLGEAAFRNCTALQKVVMPEGLQEISPSLFEGCTSLREITLPEGLLSIPNRAFKNCSSLETLVLPDTVTAIDSEAFRLCYSLTEIGFPTAELVIGVEAFAECGFEELTIPENVSLSEGTAAFVRCQSLEKLTLKGTGLLAESIFEDCIYLFDLDLGERTPWYNAFSGCTSLQKVTVPEGVTEIGTAAFSHCSELRTIELPSTLRIIQPYAFSTCYALQGIVIPEGVTDIGHEAFEDCPMLQYIELPSTLETLEENVFLLCEKVTAVAFPKGNDRFFILDNCLYSRAADGEYRLKHCFNLTRKLRTEPCTLDENGVPNIPKESFPEGFEREKDGSLWYGSKKIRISPDGTVKQVVGSADGQFLWETIPCQTVDNCISVPEIGLIDLSLLCPYSRDVFVIPTPSDGNVIIDEKAFFGSHLAARKVVIPDGVTEIGAFAFNYCEMQQVKISSTVTKIGEYAFEGCKQMTELSFTGNVTVIGECAFSCPELTKINFDGSEEQWHALIPHYIFFEWWHPVTVVGNDFELICNPPS